MPDEPSAPQPTPTNYQRTAGGHLQWQPPTPEHLQEMLPAYEVMTILGQGGMGAVYKGRQKSLDRVVAIKILPPEAAEDDMQFAERFKNEARTMAKMNHPAIVHVYDFGETSEGQLYIVMEFIDGTDVAKMIQSQGKLPEDYALSITAHVCDALGYAHTHGVVHRDIKPANVLINMDGQVKVADFGLAKATDPSQMGLTKTNMAMGTPDFVSPEALMPGVPLDGRADLYAVGVMLYNMLTGTIPRGAFRMPSATLQTDARFDQIIQKAMEMDRERRYQTALDLRRDLDVILTTPAAKSDGQTIPAQAALPQKPMGKSPGPPQGKEGSAGTPARSVPADKNARTNQTADKSVRAPVAPAKKSNAVMIYGIAAAVAVIAVAIFLFSGGEKKPAPTPKAVAETKPEPKKPDSKPATPPPSKPTPKPAESKPAPAPAAVASGNEKWVDAIAQWFGGTKTNEDFVREANGAAKGGSKRTVIMPVPAAVPRFHNQAARVRARFEGELRVYVRQTMSAGQKGYFITPQVKEQRLALSYDDFYSGKAAQFLGHFPLPAGFDYKAVHTLEFRVVGDLLTASVDGKKLGEKHDTKFADGHPAILATNITIESFEYANLDPAGAAPASPIATTPKPAPAPAAVASGNEKWVDGLAQWFGGTKTNEDFVRENNGGARIGGTARSLQPIPSSTTGFRDQAVRMRWRGANPTATGDLRVYVRLSKEASGKEVSYAAAIRPAKEVGWAVRLLGAKGGSEVLGNRDWPLPSDFKLDAPHTMELRVVGDLLTATVDGKKIAEARDSTLTAGRPAFSGHDAVIESFEYANLDPAASKPAPAPAAVAAGNEKWVDGLAQWFGGTKTHNSFVRENNGGARAAKGGSILTPIPPSAPPFRNQVARVRWHPLDAKASMFLHLRNSFDAPGKQTAYFVALSGTRVRLVGPPEEPGKPNTVLGNRDWPLAPDFKFDATHTLEFRIVGDLLTASVDGKKIAEVRDSALATGHPLLNAHDLVIESFEYANLDPGGSASALASAKPSPASPVATAAPLTKPVNLLALVDVKRDAIKGEWELKPEGLVAKKNNNSKQLLEIDLNSPEEYDFEIEFTVGEGLRDVCHLLGVPGRNFSWKMGSGRESEETLFAFGPMLDGKLHDDKTRTEAVVKHARLKAGQRYSSLVEVRKNSLRALIDGQEVLKWSGDFKRLATEDYRLKNSNHLGLASFDTTITYHKAELRPFGTSTPPTLAQANTAAPVPAPAPAPMMPAAAAPVAPADPRLAQLAAGFKARHEADALQPFNTALAALNTSYLANGVSRARTAAKAKGSLAEVTALDAEKTAIEQGRGVPAEDEADTPDSLKTLRGTYRTAHAKFATERDAKAAPLYDLYLKALDAYIAELTQADKIDIARKVQVFRDDIALQKPGAGAAAAPASGTAATTAPASSAAATPAVRAPKMNEQEVAEWAIASGGSVDVVFGTPPVRQTIAIASELPRGRFSIIEMTVNGAKAPGKDLSPLASAREVGRMHLDNTSLADKTFLDLAPLRQMTNLRTLYCGNLDAAGVEVVASLTELTALISGNLPEGSLEKIARMKQLGSFESPSIAGPGIAALKSCKKLRAINNRGIPNPVTDDDVRALVTALPDLESLSLGSWKNGPAPITNACVPSLLALKSLKILGLNGKGIDDSALETVAKLRTLETLGLEATQITGSGFKALTKLVLLQNLYLIRSPITDAALEDLAKLKTLKDLNLTETTVSEAAVAKLQAALPDCKIATK